MIVHHVGYFGEQQAFWLQYSFGLLQERRIQITQCPVLVCSARHCRAKIYIETLPAFVPSLRAYMGWIVYDDAKGR